MIDMSQFGTKLKFMISQSGMTQKEFAKLCGITSQAMNSYCTNRHLPGLDTFLLMCEKLGVSVDYMINHQGYNGPSYEHMISHTMLKYASNKELIDEFRYRLKKGTIKLNFMEISYNDDSPEGGGVTED